MLDIITTFNKNEDKHRKRGERKGDAKGYRDGETELFIKNLNNAAENEAVSKMDRSALKSAMQKLNLTQMRRVPLYYFYGLTYRKIAELEGVSDKSVRESIQGALKKIKKTCEIPLLKTPL
ncbi:MAG: sigma factor-like helix-turn-helix DNA-binding protein [Oscillospiraceae bacterium]